MSSKYIVLDNNIYAEKNALGESAGAVDEGRIPKTLANGRLADTVMSRQPVQMSVGAADEGKLPYLNSSGFLDNSVLPVGVGDNTYTVTSSGELPSNRLINTYNDGGVLKARLADAALGRPADGFTKNAVGTGEVFTLHSEGVVSGDSLAQMALPVWLGENGLQTRTPPTAAGSILQRVGTGISQTDYNFKPGLPIRLA